MKAKEIKQTMITKDMVIAAINTSWADKIIELLPLDKFAKIIYDGLKHGKLLLRSKFSAWKIDNNIIRYHRCVYVPQNEEL